MEIVGESDCALDERERGCESGGGSGEKQEAGAAIAKCEPGDADNGAEEEGESGVLLDEERKDEQDATGKSGERRKVSDSRRSKSQAQKRMQRVQSES